MTRKERVKTAGMKTGKQIEALFALVRELRKNFPFTAQGGHQGFQKLATGEGWACPGVYGMILADMLRRDLKLDIPK